MTRYFVEQWRVTAIPKPNTAEPGILGLILGLLFWIIVLAAVLGGCH